MITPAPCWSGMHFHREQEAEPQRRTTFAARTGHVSVRPLRSESEASTPSSSGRASALSEAASAASGAPKLPVRRDLRPHAAQCLRPRCADDTRPLSLASLAALPLGALLTTHILPRWQENGPQLQPAAGLQQHLRRRPPGARWSATTWRCRGECRQRVAAALSQAQADVCVCGRVVPIRR